MVSGWSDFPDASPRSVTTLFAATHTRKSKRNHHAPGNSDFRVGAFGNTHARFQVARLRSRTAKRGPRGSRHSCLSKTYPHRTSTHERGNLNDSRKVDDNIGRRALCRGAMHVGGR